LIKEVVLASLCLSKSYLREDFLSKKLKVGRSIIRQALHRFAGAGLIEHIPRRGWLVHPFGIEDMRAYLVVRELLELKALRLARPNLNKAELQQIKQRLAKSVNSDELTLDNSIHDYIIEKSKNRYIRQFFQQYVALYYTELFHFAAPEISVVEEMSSQHRCIIDALIARHWAKAEKFLAEHIEAQAAVLIKLLEKKQTEFASHESA
jgi:DNA-binding GntR family transcriptional regulator